MERFRSARKRWLVGLTIALAAVTSVSGAGRVDAVASTATLTAQQNGSLIVVTGNGFSASVPVVVVVRVGGGSARATATPGTDSSFVLKFAPFANFSGIVRVQAGALTAVTNFVPLASTVSTSPSVGSRNVPSSWSAGTGWSSGASCDGAADGTFGTWRGEPVTAVATWNDYNLYAFDGELKDFEGNIDNAFEPFPRDGGGSWADAAAGAYDQQWTSAMQKLARDRAGKSGVVYNRLAWEMNGDWYGWKVDSSNVNDFKRGWARFHQIMRANYPEGKLVFGVNHDSHSDVTAEQMWPGDDVVDVVGVDLYDQWPSYTSLEVWQEQYMDGGVQDPGGIGSWQAFAKAHGKPYSFPEWGINWEDTNSAQDNPLYIQLMHDFFADNAGTGPGQVIYEIYFNCSPDDGDTTFKIMPAVENVNAAKTYQQLSWGTGSAAKTTAAPTAR